MTRLPNENRPDWTTFIQWKGTDLCMDFWCPECGGHSHFDGYFGYHVQCGNCDARFEMPTDIPVKMVDKADGQLTLYDDEAQTEEENDGSGSTED